VQLELFFSVPKLVRSSLTLTVGAKEVPLHFVRNRRARRYVLRVRKDGSARVTIPRGGSPNAAQAFALRHVAWVEKQLRRLAEQSPGPKVWGDGTEVYYHGQPTPLVVRMEECRVLLADQAIPLAEGARDLRASVEEHLGRMAAPELVARTLQLAAAHQLTVAKVRVRHMKSRWGSCSARRTICLNWRLIQTPDSVRDYIILHELMHLREMNHSRRFWKHVARVCPNYAEAEAWLKQHKILWDGV
jgi:predicted metal-dependent hydrolase